MRRGASVFARIAVQRSGALYGREVLSSHLQVFVRDGCPVLDDDLIDHSLLRDGFSILDREQPVVFMKERNFFRVVVIPNELDRQQPGLPVSVNGRADVIDHLADKGLQRVLAVPSQTHAKALGVEALRSRQPGSLVNERSR
jgi:hypothetical protein